MSKTSKNVTIIGAGAAGAALALLLREQGHRVALFDGRADSRQISGPAFRTIAVTLSDRGFKVFRRLGLEEAVHCQSIAASGRMMHSGSGEVFKQPYAENGQALHCVARIDLDQLLLEAVNRAGDIGMHFLHQCVSVDFDSNRATFREKASGKLHVAESDYIIGADGATSAFRQMMADAGKIKTEAISFSGGYKEFLLPGRPNGSWILNPSYIHVWPRGDYTFIAFPALRGEFIAMLFMPVKSGPVNEGEERELIQNEFVDLNALAPHIADQCAATTLVPLRRVRCNPWTYGERVALIGDAAHAILPFYGQGMNASLEDCQVLADCLGNSSLPSPLQEFERLRKPNADAIDELAVEHYQYLTTFAQTPQTIRMKEYEGELASAYPGEFLPVYRLVAFSALPYRACQRVHQLQSDLLQQLASLKDPFSWERPDIQGLVGGYRNEFRRIQENPIG